MSWDQIVLAVAWALLYGGFVKHRAHRVGWIRGYLACKHEEYPGEFWPEGMTEARAMEIAKMLRRQP